MSDADYLIESLSKDLVLLLIEDFNMDMKTALLLYIHQIPMPSCKIQRPDSIFKVLSTFMIF